MPCPQSMQRGRLGPDCPVGKRCAQQSPKAGRGAGKATLACPCDITTAVLSRSVRSSPTRHCPQCATTTTAYVSHHREPTPICRSTCCSLVSAECGCAFGGGRTATPAGDGSELPPGWWLAMSVPSVPFKPRASRGVCSGTPNDAPGSCGPRVPFQRIRVCFSTRKIDAKPPL